jgi:hypothetical protein
MDCGCLKRVASLKKSALDKKDVATVKKTDFKNIVFRTANN